MASSMRTARWVAILLVLQLAGLIFPFAILHPLVPPDFIDHAAASADQLRLAIALLLANGILAIAISTLSWPVLRRRSEVAPLLLLAGGVVMLSLQAVDSAHLLSMLSLSQQYASDAGRGDVLRTMAETVRSTRRWVHYMELFSIEVWIGMLYAVLLRYALVPRVLALVGLATAILHFAAVVAPFFQGQASIITLGMPMGGAQLVLAGWLAAKGFNERSTRPS